MDYGGIDDGTGSNNTALQSAIAASSNDQAIILPAGIFSFSNAYLYWGGIGDYMRVHYVGGNINGTRVVRAVFVEWPLSCVEVGRGVS